MKKSEKTIVFFVTFVVVYFILENVGLVPIIRLETTDMRYNIRPAESTVIFLLAILLISFLSLWVSDKGKTTKTTAVLAILVIGMLSSNLIDVDPPEYPALHSDKIQINVNYTVFQRNYSLWEYELNGTVKLNQGVYAITPLSVYFTYVTVNSPRLDNASLRLTDNPTDVVYVNGAADYWLNVTTCVQTTENSTVDIILLVKKV